MSENPLISVIIPVYNGEKYVRSCLQNMQNQSYENLEIIVVDDGSSDRSREIVNEFPVEVIRHDKNRGLSAARNTGIDAAQGEYIHFMDVDDGINADYYKEMVSAIVEHGADMACSGMINERYGHRTLLFSKKAVYSETQEKLKATYAGRWGYAVRYLYRTDFLKEHALRFEEGRFIEDLMFSLPAVFFANKLVVVPGSTYTYYHRENSIMTNEDPAHRKKRRADLAHAKAFRRDFAKKHNIKIPSVNTGQIAYLFRKLYLSIKKSK